jgi:protein gp37
LGPRGRSPFLRGRSLAGAAKWNAEAVIARVRRRVFCASMADVFEDRVELRPVREKLWNLIAQTPALDWLLLTKRPENFIQLAPWRDRWPPNVWAGVTAENQLWADRRIPLLLRLPAVVRFVSCEPLLGRLDLGRWIQENKRIDWVIAGGESGHKARPMNPEWARSLRDQCAKSGVPFHFKQWGHWRPEYDDAPLTRKRVSVEDSKGRPITLIRVGKHAAGRDLDGQVWDEFPVGQRDRVAAR